MTTRIVICDVKDPDGWGRVIQALKLSKDTSNAFFEFGEYASLELTIDENLRIVEGRILPVM
jgi:hypothetical protein